MSKDIDTTLKNDFQYTEEIDIDLLSNGPLQDTDLVQSPLILGTDKSTTSRITALDSTPAAQIALQVGISKQASCDDELLMMDEIGSSVRKQTICYNSHLRITNAHQKFKTVVSPTSGPSTGLSTFWVKDHMARFTRCSA